MSPVGRWEVCLLGNPGGKEYLQGKRPRKTKGKKNTPAILRSQLRLSLRRVLTPRKEGDGGWWVQGLTILEWLV